MMPFSTDKFAVMLLAAVGVANAAAQTPPAAVPPGAAPPVQTMADIHIIVPSVDAQKHQIELPAAFWNQHMADWVEVAMCGRPSDFLHETVVSVTTTKDDMIVAMRAAGFHDADAWVANVQDFPRIRGDRALVLLHFNDNGKAETFSLDELLSFDGWGTSVGPYGWMFKGDPEHSEKPQSGPNTQPDAHPNDTDATRIIRDDPQVALVFNGLQHVSQSFMDHPLAYDDWAYPQMNFVRNTAVLPQSLFDSNGAVPIRLTIQKVNEEEFLTGVANVWHDPAAAAYIRRQIPVARGIDRDKSALWAALPALRKLAPDPAHAPADLGKTEVFQRVSLLAAKIEKGYATLDAAWAEWAADHAKVPANGSGKNGEGGDDASARATLAQETKLWREHLDLRRERADQLEIAEQASFDEAALERKASAGGGTVDDEALRKLHGRELAARSRALLAQTAQSRERWHALQKSTDPHDPRTAYLRDIAVHVRLTDAQQAAGQAGADYGDALAKESPPPVLHTTEAAYARAQVDLRLATLEMQLASVNFEISKREGLDNDPDLPGLRKEKAQLEAELQTARAATRPAK